MTSSISLDVIVIIISDVTSISVFIVRARETLLLLLLMMMMMMMIVFIGNFGMLASRDTVRRLKTKAKQRNSRNLLGYVIAVSA